MVNVLYANIKWNWALYHSYWNFGNNLLRIHILLRYIFNNYFSFNLFYNLDVFFIMECIVY